MSWTIFPTNGAKKRELERSAEPDDQITPEQLQDESRMQRLWMRVLRDLKSLLRRWSPDIIEYEDFPFNAGGTTLYRFDHGLGGRIRWYVVDWHTATDPASLVRDDATTSEVLVLRSYPDGTGTIRIERSG